MKIEITEKKENPILSRLEIKGNVEFDSVTPSNSELKESLAKELESTKNLIIVKNIFTKYGERKADYRAYQYFSEDALKSMEKASENKDPAAVKEAPKTEAKPAEIKKEESKSEENKE